MVFLLASATGGTKSNVATAISSFLFLDQEAFSKNVVDVDS